MTTPTNKLTEVLQAIRDANPETMELSFGCKIVLKKRGNGNTGTKNVIVTDNTDLTQDRIVDYYNPQTGKNGWFVNDDGLKKIIGHPLHIGHLLKALSDSCNDHPLQVLEIHISGIGLYFRKSAEVGEEPEEYTRLTFTQPLEQQLQSNPELVETLHTLIVK